MNNKLSKLYTKKGDLGMTSLGNGNTVSKDDIRIEICGVIDELASLLGLLSSFEKTPKKILTILDQIQNELINAGSEFSSYHENVISLQHVNYLEKHINELERELPQIKNFIKPEGNLAAAACHMARAVCRRLERRIVTLSKRESINPTSLQYFNRLSDLLFVIARILAQ